MGMAQGYGQGIGRIFLGEVGQSQHGFDHMLDLPLGRITLADNGFLDLGGSVFMDWQVASGHHADCRTPRLSQFQGRISVAMHKNLFNRNDRRLVLIHNFGQPFNQNT